MSVTTADKVIKWKLLKDRVKLIRAMLDYVYNRARFDAPSIQMRDVIIRIRKDEGKHFLSYSQEEGGKVSYASKPEYKYDNVHRYKTTLGRYLRRQLGITQDYLPDRYVEQMSYDVFGLLISQDVVPIALVAGQKLMDAYEHGIGSESCMTGSYAKYTELYAENPGKVQLAIYSNGRKARALLWNTDEGKQVLDRIYPNEGSHVRAMQEWAVSNGYDYRPHTGMDDHSLSDDKRYHVTLKATDYCPYMDTFKRGKYIEEDNTVILSNDNHFGEFQLERTDGRPPWSNCCSCGNCGRGLDEDNALQDDEGNYYCEACWGETYSYCERCGNDYDREDGHHIHDIDEYWCDRCTSRYTHECDECGENHRDDCVYTDDTEKTYCPSCAEHKDIGQCCACDKMVECTVLAEDTESVYCKDCARDKLHLCNDCSKYYEEGIDECSDGKSRCSECRERWEEDSKDGEEETEKAHKVSAKRRLVATTR